jgi:hypothetical protein
MKRTLLAGVFALICTAPAAATEFEAGDRGCLGYDAASHSCMSIQEVVSAKDGKITVADRTILKLGRKPLTLMSRGSMARSGEGYCIDASASEYSAEPKSHVYAAAMPKMIRTQMAALTGLGHCIKHRFCGDSVVVDSYVAGVERPAMRQVFRLFRKDDPAADGLTGRETTVAQMQRIGSAMPKACELGAS